MPKRARINFTYNASISSATWNNSNQADYSGFVRKPISSITVVDGTTVAVTYTTAHGYGSQLPYILFTDVAGMTQINNVVGYRVAGGDTNTFHVNVGSTSGFSTYTSGGYGHPAHATASSSTYKSLRDDTDGTVTGWRIHASSVNVPEPLTTGMVSVGSGDAAWADDTKALQYGYGYGASPSFTFTGLNPAKTYTLEVIGSRDTTAARLMSLVVGAQSDEIDAWDNVSQVATLSGLSPDANGLLQFSLTENNAVDFIYLNALRITEADGASAVMPGLLRTRHGTAFSTAIQRS